MHMSAPKLATLALALTLAGGAAWAEDASFASRFAGSYVGITGGYDIPTSSPYIAAQPNLYWIFPELAFPVLPATSLGGAKIGALAGYNLVSDRFLLGIEGRGQYSFASSDKGFNYRTSQLSYWILNPGADFYGKVERPVQFDLSARGGFILENWLVFAKAGAGVEQVKTRSLTDNLNSAICDDAPICSITRPLGKFSSARTVWYGYALAGLGIERNFGNLFTRIEAEVQMHRPLRDASYTPAANLTLGYRF